MDRPQLSHRRRTPEGSGQNWRLAVVNLRQDPGETHDLSAENPDKRMALLALWEQYVKTNGVILTGDGPFAKRSR